MMDETKRVVHELRMAARSLRDEPWGLRFFGHMHAMLEAADILERGDHLKDKTE